MACREEDLKFHWWGSYTYQSVIVPLLLLLSHETSFLSSTHTIHDTHWHDADTDTLLLDPLWTNSRHGQSHLVFTFLYWPVYRSCCFERPFYNNGNERSQSYHPMLYSLQLLVSFIVCFPWQSLRETWYVGRHTLLLSLFPAHQHAYHIDLVTDTDPYY